MSTATDSSSPSYVPTQTSGNTNAKPTTNTATTTLSTSGTSTFVIILISCLGGGSLLIVLALLYFQCSKRSNSYRGVTSVAVAPGG